MCATDSQVLVALEVLRVAVPEVPEILRELLLVTRGAARCHAGAWRERARGLGG